MALPERKYFDIKEVAKRWFVTKQDIYYYIENDMLEACIWLRNTTVDIGYYEVEKNGNSFPVVEETKIISGLYPLKAGNSRALFNLSLVNSPQLAAVPYNLLFFRGWPIGSIPRSLLRGSHFLLKARQQYDL